MSLASYETLTFTQEEKKEIALALNNVLDDLEALWSITPTKSIYAYYNIKDDDWSSDSRELKIDIEGIKIIDREEIILEKFGRKNIRPKITEYTEIFYFIKKYEKIRKSIERKIEKSRREKQQGIDEIIEIRNRYTKEATIEIDVPESINPHKLTVKEEDGKAIGEIKMGAGTIRIITKGSIVVANKKEPVKVKGKKL